MSDESSASPVSDQLAAFTSQVRAIRESLHQTVVGQDAAIDLLLTCALTGSHALLVGVPGLGEDADGQGARRRFSLEVLPHPIHARPDAVGHHRL